MRDRVTVLAPAKLNLALDVVGILPGGYHALDMTMQAVSLYERWLSSTIRACWRVQTSPSIRASPSGPVWPAAAPTLRLFWWV